jgi:hypothetical protein
MPNQANITVKKNDGTTDIIWTGVQGASGDRSPAIWRSLTVGVAPAFQPRLEMTARPSGTGSARRMDVEFVYPYTTVGSDGKTNTAEKAVFTGSFLQPLGMPTTDFNEAVAQAMNLLASAHMKANFQSGYAAT